MERTFLISSTYGLDLVVFCALVEMFVFVVVVVVEIERDAKNDKNKCYRNEKRPYLKKISINLSQCCFLPHSSLLPLFSIFPGGFSSRNPWNVL